jgi:PAS domain S-box-containing protein
MADARTSPGLEAVLQAVDSEALLATPPRFIDILPVAIFACEVTGRVCWHNIKAAEIWGRIPEPGERAGSLSGTPRIYELDGGLVAEEENAVETVLRTGEPVLDRIEIVRRGDDCRTISIQVSPLRDRVGSLIGAVACCHDVTETHREESAARASESQLRDILNALPAAVYTTDAEGRITFYNEAAVEMSGRRPELGQDSWCVTWKLYTPDGEPLAHDQCPMAQALKENRPIRGVEAVAERPDGSRVPFIPYPTPLHDAAGDLVGAVNMLVDISHRKEAESRQRLLFSELNHRIKNNMQMLHALLSAGRREAKSEEARAALDDAAARVASMAAAQTALYQSDNLSRFESGSFLDSVCESAGGAIPDGVEIVRHSTAGDLGNDVAVPLALILNELITNAAKYGVPGGEGSIRVALSDENGLFTLKVEDDGPGFDPCEISRRSSGLGLVAGLVRQIGGSFAVEPGAGARCIVRFRDGSDRG